MRALLVAGSPSLGEGDFDGDYACGTEEALELARNYSYDVIIVRAARAADVVRRLRNAKVTAPIVVFTDERDPDRVVQLFDMGADDVTGPCAHKELMARLRAIVRRANGHHCSEVQVGRLTVDLSRHRATVGHMSLNLTASEQRFLEALALRKGHAVAKDVLASRLGDVTDGEAAVDSHMCRLRKKIAALTGGQHYIRTVYGCGYELAEA